MSSDDKGPVTIKGRKVLINGKRVLFAGENVENVVFSGKFSHWAYRLHSDFNVESIIVRSTKFNQHGLLFATLDCEATCEGKEVPGGIFLKGDAVAVVIILVDGATQEKYTVILRQPRLATGNPRFREIPAGMLDNSGDFVGKAAAEIKEETGIVVNTDELIRVGDPFWPSCGACDERIQLFYTKRVMSHNEILALHNQQTGNAHEKEFLTVEVIKLKDLLKTCAEDGKTLSACALLASIGEYEF